MVKTLTKSRVFTDLLSNSPKSSARFSPGYEGTENMFYFLNKTQVNAFIFVNSATFLLLEITIFKILKLYINVKRLK